MSHVNTKLVGSLDLVGVVEAVAPPPLTRLTSQPLGVVLDGPEDGPPLRPKAAVNDGVAGQEVRHRGRVEVTT